LRALSSAAAWGSIRKNIAGLLVLAALVLLVYSDVAFMGRTFSTSSQVVGVNGVGTAGIIPPVGSPANIPLDEYRVDRGASAWAFEPWAQVVHQILTKGEMPLWNPYQGAGTPLAANMQSAVLDPFLLPVHLHPSPLVWDLSFLFALIGIAWFSYLFFRSLGFGAPASVAGAAAFALSGYFLLYSNNQFFRSYFFVPVLLLLVDRVIASSRVRWVGLLGAALAANIFLGMPEASLAVISLAGAYTVFRWLTSAERGGRRLAALRLAGAGALGLCLASPLVLLFFQYLNVGWSGHPPGAGTGLYSDPKRNLLPWVMPFLVGKPSVDAAGLFSGARDWIGSGALALILFGLTSRREMWRRPGVFFAAAAALLLLKIYGFPVVQALGRLPALSQANFPVFFVPVLGFCLAALVASGAQAIADRSWHKWALLGELVGTIAAVGWLLRANAPALHAATGSHSVGQFGLAMVAAGVVLVSVLTLSSAQARWVVTVAVVGELIILAPHGFYAPRADPYRPPSWLTAVGFGEQRTTDRVFAFDAKLFPDTAGVFGIQDIRSIDAIYPARYVKYISTFIQPDFGTRFVGGAYGQLEGSSHAQVVGNPMVDLLGVRYIISGGTAPDDPFIDGVFAHRAPDARVNPAIFDLGGDRRPVLFEHSGAEVSLPVGVPDPQQVVFSYGMHPDAFRDISDDGVVFALDGVTRSGLRVPLWSASYIPRSDPVTPVFRDAAVPIPAALGADLASLVLRVEPRLNSRTDWAGWNNLRVIGSTPTAVVGKLPVLVSSSGGVDGVDVYENQDRLPRAFVARNITYVPDMESAVRTLTEGEPLFQDRAVHVTRFHPRNDAVVEGLAPSNQASAPCSAGGDSARITAYAAGEVSIDVNSPCRGLLVLSDTYFPGWEATVNGKPATICPTDVLFRGVAVDKGHSVVVFRYRPANFSLGLLIALAGVLALVAVAVWRRVRPGRSAVDVPRGAGRP
jgi:hypothetical protein